MLQTVIDDPHFLEGKQQMRDSETNRAALCRCKGEKQAIKRKSLQASITRFSLLPSFVSKVPAWPVNLSFSLFPCYMHQVASVLSKLLGLGCDLVSQ